MKILILLTSLTFSLNLLSKTYNCSFTHNDSEDQVELKVNKKKTITHLEFKGQEYNYKDCKTQKDQFGTLIDCNSGLTDLMILLNEQEKPASGGIMSSTHDLFVDLKC